MFVQTAEIGGNIKSGHFDDFVRTLIQKRHGQKKNLGGGS